MGEKRATPPTLEGRGLFLFSIEIGNWKIEIWDVEPPAYYRSFIHDSAFEQEVVLGASRPQALSNFKFPISNFIIDGAPRGSSPVGNARLRMRRASPVLFDDTGIAMVISANRLPYNISLPRRATERKGRL